MLSWMITNDFPVKPRSIDKAKKLLRILTETMDELGQVHNLLKEKEEVIQLLHRELEHQHKESNEVVARLQHALQEQQQITEETRLTMNELTSRVES